MPWCCASAPRTCRGSRTSRASTAIATLRSSPWTAWDWGLRLGAEYLNAKNFTTVNTLAASVYGTSAIVTGSAGQRQGGRRFGLGVVQFRRAVVGVRAL